MKIKLQGWGRRIAVTAGMFLSVGCGTAVTFSSAATSGGSANGPAPQSAVQVMRFNIAGSGEGALGPDGRRHDTFRPTTSTTVVVGHPVTVTITNTDDVPHSFTSPALGIDETAPGASNGRPGVVTFTFTPAATGTFRWYCRVPCDTDNNGWAMGSYAGMMGGYGMMQTGVDGFMAGYVTVTS